MIEFEREARPEREPAKTAYRVALSNGTSERFDAERLVATKGVLAFQTGGEVTACVGAGQWLYWQKIGPAEAKREDITNG